MKTCVTCKHHVKDALYKDSCVRDARPDLITGKNSLNQRHCTAERYPIGVQDGICGKEGKYWEPKPEKSDWMKELYRKIKRNG